MQGDRGRALRARVALAGGLVALAVALVATLSQASVRRAGSNNNDLTQIGALRGPGATCQPGELVPGGTRTLQLGLAAGDGGGPRVAVTVRAGGRTLASGDRRAGWTGFLTVRLDPPIAADARASVCLRLAAGPRVAALGAAVADERPLAGLPGRLRIEYLRSGRESWWALAPTVVDRMGLSIALGGATPWLAALLLLSAVALTVRQLLRAARG